MKYILISLGALSILFAILFIFVTFEAEKTGAPAAARDYIVRDSLFRSKYGNKIEFYGIVTGQTYDAKDSGSAELRFNVATENSKVHAVTFLKKRKNTWIVDSVRYVMSLNH
jgi:hypothetical protein